MLQKLKKMMKKEKGFTLVELLAVIVILGVILAIAVPAIGNVISDSETKADEANIDLFISAARLAHVSGLVQQEYTVEDLVDAGYLDVKEGEISGTVKVTAATGTTGLKFDHVP